MSGYTCFMVVMENVELYVLIEFVCESKDIVDRSIFYIWLFIGWQF